jgi:hypothetical protein
VNERLRAVAAQKIGQPRIPRIELHNLFRR